MSEEGLFVDYKAKTESRLDPETGNYEITTTFTYPDPDGPVWKYHIVPEATDENK